MAVKTETRPQYQPSEKDKVKEPKPKCPLDPSCKYSTKDGTCISPGRCPSAPR